MAFNSIFFGSYHAYSKALVEVGEDPARPSPLKIWLAVSGADPLA